MARILITGGAGFIGSHAALHFARKGWSVRILDNLSRGRLLHKDDPNARHNWDRLGADPRIERIEGDVRSAESLAAAVDGVDAVLHAAAQTAVTTSTVDPATDFETNAAGTFRVLDAIRRTGRKASLLYCSTNKVYGENVNHVPLIEDENRYRFGGDFTHGIPESFGIDLCEHTPYGCSKLTGDLYVQDFGHLYGLRVGVFRMSCIYGTHQFGLEDQGWVAWFAIAALRGAPLTIFGDGKQVRDVLWVDDLVGAYDAFLEHGPQIGVYNMGGGAEHTLSLRELLAQLEERLGRPVPVGHGDWRPSDQKVYVSDIRKAQKELAWRPQVTPREGVDRLLTWVRENEGLFSHFGA
ncbi:MAG: NAD-dependent epimerase/dehydratase family protein [Candidatus Eisenbacteria bacterium]|uniref:NAD-dependent epimerase/dehydratase family protein n=1 Tax=Eiseniibacteriota bacterium TaxID=2212470 RepID=A0A956RS88_UNCEI|nr:NAD-dependent epimerase/dehydratase family protein [Candidatus Eisenbacteria bacterium]